MELSDNAFDERLAEWKVEQQQPWMRLRYTLGQALLARHLPAAPLRILDAGGGNGPDALPLAAQGHYVTLLDNAAAMLEDARRTADTAGYGNRLVTHQAGLADLPTLFPEPTFDMVLCHNVVMYLPDPFITVNALAAALRPGGLFSLIAVNPASEALRLALRLRDPTAALAHLDPTSVCTPLFDIESRRYPIAEMERWLDQSGCTVIARYGIRCIIDYIADDACKRDPHFFAALEQLELALSDRAPYRQIARFVHFVASRGGAARC